jgi:hypothetical protein
MTLLDGPRSDATEDREATPDEFADLDIEREDAAGPVEPEAAPTTAAEPRADATTRERPLRAPRVDPTGQVTYRGMRIRRVRLKSVAKLSFVFWFLAFTILVGTAVVVWNVAQAFGYVESFEDTMITSLGLESFEIDGGGIFGLLASGVALLCLLGWLATIGMAAVYNAACGVLGGLAVETGPLQRRRRVFSWRHRGFVTVSE